MRFKSLKDINLKNKRVLLRADLNVPAVHGRITDMTRIERLKPTIDYLRKEGAKTLVISHFGRPEGEQNPQMSLAFMLPALEKAWDTEVRFSPDCIGPKAMTLSQNLLVGEVALLENVRFYKGEEANDESFAKSLAVLGDIYINDAFSAAHRAHASTEGLAHMLPSAAGLLMEEELNALDQALGSPQKPVAAITGGSKISTKLAVLNNLVTKVDYLILGGGMANTFLYAKGADIGNSLCEKSMADEARKIIKIAEENSCEIILPIDSVVVSEISGKADIQTVSSLAIPSDKMAIDVGPQTLDYIGKKIDLCKTIVWNGPMGVFEIKPFDKGTNALAEIVAAKTSKGECVSVAGGGDTVAALENAGVTEKFTYISSAGGAFLEWLEGKRLPGITALAA
ncbi:MAG: phosphoglycerate kinase [Alphaproteobacteria bacterium]